MERYKDYKDSGVEWLGLLPSDWESIRIDWCSEMVRGNTALKKDELLPEGDYVALQYGKTYKVDEVDNKFQFYVNKELYKKGQLVNFGDTILISTSETLEDLGHSCFYNRIDLGLLGGEQILLKPKCKIIIEKYLFFYSKFFCLELRKYATGLKVFRFNIDDLKNIFIPIPPLKEQTQIANYLDAKTTLIDKKIKLLKQKIKHYKAYRKTLINETVTKGLDKSVKLKDSGINWIGEIPEHWEVKRFKEVCYKNHTGGTPSTSNTDMFKGDNIWVTIADMKKDDLVFDSKLKLTDEAIKTSNIPITPKGSLLYSFKLTLGKIAFAAKDIYTNEAIISILPNKNIVLRYHFYMLPIYLLLNATENIYGAKMLNQKLISNALLLHPTIKEQQQIAEYLDAKTTTIDNIVNNIETQITTLKELRKTLINEVVTGKVKVTA